MERVLRFAIAHGLVESEDRAFVRNVLLDILGLKAPVAQPEGDETLPETITQLLTQLTDDAVSRGIIPDSAGARDRFGVRICGAITPAPRVIREQFAQKYAQEGPRAATKWFYKLCRACDYIRVDHIAKNKFYIEDSPAGPLEVTINLSKPEKDPLEIAAVLEDNKVSYPKCMLCVQNEGYAGRPGYPARFNHRIVPLSLSGDRYLLQYSPYLYYNEHCIVLNHKHIPMKVDRQTIERLFDFVEQFPHYFLGSNADLPIVGGSILDHDHFQGGAHVFPMDKAKPRMVLNAPDDGIEAYIVNWPMTCIRLIGSDREQLIDASVKMLDAWRAYSDESEDVLSHTYAPHNTITPIVRRMADEWLVHLVLRNNRVTKEHPLGIFHPHADLHHIKKENIGLIEVMGLFILPGRLLPELDAARAYLTGQRALSDIPAPTEEVSKHYDWICELAKVNGSDMDAESAQRVLRQGLAAKCARVLADAGVFKNDEAGNAALLRFMGTLGYKQ